MPKIKGWKRSRHDPLIYHSPIIQGRKSSASVMISKWGPKDWRVLSWPPDSGEYTKYWKFKSKKAAKIFATVHMKEWTKAYLKAWGKK